MMMKLTIEKTESDRELLSQLLSELKKEGLLSGNQVIEVQLYCIFLLFIFIICLNVLSSVKKCEKSFIFIFV